MFIYQEYLLTLIIFLVSCIFILLGYVVGNVGMSQPEVSYEKVSSYECGFDAFSDAREPFDVKFYLIAILFIIFDVEVIFFFLGFYVYVIYFFMVFTLCLFLLVF
jgi:NADH-quinone oxidoreductase subunit A